MLIQSGLKEITAASSYMGVENAGLKTNLAQQTAGRAVTAEWKKPCASDTLPSVISELT